MRDVDTISKIPIGPISVFWFGPFFKAALSALQRYFLVGHSLFTIEGLKCIGVLIAIRGLRYNTISCIPEMGKYSLRKKNSTRAYKETHKESPHTE